MQLFVRLIYEFGNKEIGYCGKHQQQDKQTACFVVEK
jgi:hypothetical protein